MLLRLYERAIRADGTEYLGRLVGEIRFRGDGTPGKIEFYDACDEYIEVKDVNHPFYGENFLILKENRRENIKRLLNKPYYIMTGGGLDRKTGLHSSEGRTLEPWYRETIEYFLEYEFRGTICGKIIEPYIVSLYYSIKHRLKKKFWKLLNPPWKIRKKKRKK